MCADERAIPDLADVFQMYFVTEASEKYFLHGIPPLAM